MSCKVHYISLVYSGFFFFWSVISFEVIGTSYIKISVSCFMTNSLFGKFTILGAMKVMLRVTKTTGVTVIYKLFRAFYTVSCLRISNCFPRTWKVLMPHSITDYVEWQNEIKNEKNCLFFAIKQFAVIENICNLFPEHFRRNFVIVVRHIFPNSIMTNKRLYMWH